MVDQNKEARDAACREALGILAQEQAAFEAWRDSLETVPTIKALRTKAEDIRQSEFEKARPCACTSLAPSVRLGCPASPAGSAL